VAQCDHPLSYRVFRIGDRWNWEVLSLGRCIGSGVQPTLVKARTEAILFAILEAA
jgi:hypothetical protein